MRIFLIGYMGCGKSKTGKRLASKLGYGFIDLDTSFEKAYKTDINNFFDSYGEKKFRKSEHELLKQVIKYENTVISVGGGTPCFYDNMEIINKTGISVYIKMDTKSLFSRLSKSKKQRPLLKGLTNIELGNFIENQLSEREKYYIKAKYVVDGINLDVSEIIKMVGLQV